METLPKEILDIIFNYLDLKNQLNLRLVSKLFENLKIKDLYNIPDKYRNKLSDDILSLPIFSELKKLNAENNQKITNKIIKKFKETLEVLDASSSKFKITDEDLRRLNFHTSFTFNNSSITNKVINGMKLHTLYTNKKITDEGIKGMDLHTLDASYNLGITDEGIKGMNLHNLNASGNIRITDEGIKGMDLHILNANQNAEITDKGIKEMNLHTLLSYDNENITYKIKNGIKTYK